MKLVIQFFLNTYHLFVSPWLGTRCRFTPSCSEYAKQAYEQHSLSSATILTAKRLCRCHPWGGHGYDPVAAPKITSVNPDTAK